MNLAGRLDGLGAVLSLACSLHCLATPALFALVPSLMIALHSFNAPLRDWAIVLMRLQAYEATFMVATAGLALISASIGWRRHRCWRPFVWIAAGLVAFCASWIVAMSVIAHGVLAALGGLSLVAAHLANRRRLGQACGSP